MRFSTVIGSQTYKKLNNSAAEYTIIKHLGFIGSCVLTLEPWLTCTKPQGSPVASEPNPGHTTDQNLKTLKMISFAPSLGISII